MKILHFVLLFFIVLLAACLRFYQIDSIPHGLSADEVSIGYNAYTILHQGKDEYGESFPLFFRAFGEYKLPVYIYLTSLSMAIFGKTEFAVRFPSALFGTATVFLFYFFLKALFSLDKKTIFYKMKEQGALLGSFLLAIIPFHIQFSRGGFEANVALFLYILGLYCFIQYYISRRLGLLVTGSLLFLLTCYTYNAYKLISLVTLLISFILFYKHSLQSKRTLIYIGITLFVLSVPFLLFSVSSAGASRFIQTSTFAEYSYLPFIQKVLVYPVLYIHNYLSYFSFPFLFVMGDGIGRHSQVGLGPFFRCLIPLFLVGAFYLVKEYRSFTAKLTIFLFLGVPLTAAFTQPSPHELRALLLVMPCLIAIVCGVLYLWSLRSWFLKIALGGIFIFMLYEFGFYLHTYYVHYPLRTAWDWGAEYKQLVSEISQRNKDYDAIIIHENVGIFFPEYAKFYDDKLDVKLVSTRWKKPKVMKNQKVLFISKGSPIKMKYAKERKRLTFMHFADINESPFVQIWELK